MKLSLVIPGFDGAIKNNPATNFPANNNFRLADVLSAFGEVALYVGGFMMFFWAAWGVFDYIRAEGNKEALAKARKRIQWAIAGFVILILAFLMSSVVQTALFGNIDLGTAVPAILPNP